MEKEIYLAGGCFWGIQEYFSRINGVLSSQSGYAQSKIANPDYRQVCSGNTGAAETVKVRYDSAKVPLALLLRHYFRIIDPLSHNRQGNDVGTQYRTGIYYTDAQDAPIIKSALQREQEKYDAPLAVEMLPLANYYPAEDYHQDYLKKNPGGYCHISFASLNDPDLQVEKDNLKHESVNLSPMSHHVTRENGTEPPFTGQYWNFFQPGIYVDITSGKPLFASSDKFHSSCGWPAFSRPIDQKELKLLEDNSHGMQRVEVRSANSDSHLGHVFNDGPSESGGLRYCINSAALRFVPLENMKKEGYGDYIQFIKK